MSNIFIFYRLFTPEHTNNSRVTYIHVILDVKHFFYFKISYFNCNKNLSSRSRYCDLFLLLLLIYIYMIRISKRFHYRFFLSLIHKLHDLCVRGWGGRMVCVYSIGLKPIQTSFFPLLFVHFAEKF